MTLDFATLLQDEDLGGASFAIVRKSWLEDSGVPRLAGVERILASGTVHPADPTRLSLLPEEARQAPVVLIHSTEPLSLGLQEDTTWTSPDEIHFDNHVYRVFQLRPWRSFGFWKAWAVQIA